MAAPGRLLTSLTLSSPRSEAVSFRSSVKLRRMDFQARPKPIPAVFDVGLTGGTDSEVHPTKSFRLLWDVAHSLAVEF